MAVYNSNNLYSEDDLKFVSTFDIPIFDLRQIESAVDMGIKYSQEDIDQVRANFENISNYEDELLKVRADTDKQKLTLEVLKKDYGLTPTTFATLDRDSLKSPYASRGIGTSLKRLTSDPRFIQSQLEIKAGDEFRDGVRKVKDQRLRDRAMLRYQEYLNGNVAADKLNITDFDYVDVGKELVEAIKLVPEITTSDFVVSPSGNLEGIKATQQRHVDAVNQMLANLIKTNPAVAENMKARGWMDEQGNATPEFTKIQSRLVDEYTKGQTTITNVKEVNERRTTGVSDGGRFGTASEAERAGNTLDDDIANNGFELPDASVVLAAASKNGYIEVDPTTKEGSLVTVGEDGTVLRRVPLKKSTKKVTTSDRDYGNINLSGEAFPSITNIVAEIESAGSGDYEAWAPSTKTGAAGRYQFIYYWHKDLIDRALKETGVDVKNTVINPKINNSRKTMDKDTKQIISAFIGSKEAQDLAWSYWYEDVLGMLKGLRSDAEVDTSKYSDAELFYIIHHEGSEASAKNFLLNNISDHEKQNTMATFEVNNSLDKIRRILKTKGATGNMTPEGGFEITPEDNASVDFGTEAWDPLLKVFRVPQYTTEDSTTQPSTIADIED